MNKSWWESPVCWLCDYGMFALIFLLTILLGTYRFLYTIAPVTPFIDPTPTHMIATLTNTPPPTKLPLTPTFIVTSTPTVEKPEFILVFVPVNWQLGQPAFQQAAQNQSDIFIRESNIENYFDVTVVALNNGIENASLGSDTLVYDVQEFALQVQAGDRYVGLTDGDLSPNGENDVVGWTSGGSAMVAEYQDEYVVAHELGHTFGLCDEYSYTDWRLQNMEYSGGCPNPYPKDCPRKESNEPICDGAPASDGSNSVMGPAGLLGSYSFNEASYKYLQNFFEDASNGSIP